MLSTAGVWETHGKQENMRPKIPRPHEAPPIMKFQTWSCSQRGVEGGESDTPDARLPRLETLRRDGGRLDGVPGTESIFPMEERVLEELVR